MGNEARKKQEKDLRLNDILGAAEPIFMEKGFESTTMDEIALAAEYTKRTVYQYFPGKEDIYFALALRAFQNLIQSMEPAFLTDKTGADQLLDAGMVYQRLFEDNPGRFLLLSRVRNVHSREEESVYHQGIVQCQGTMFKLFSGAIVKGQSDGSIRSDVEPFQGALYIASSSISLFSELAENQTRIESQFGLDVSDFMRLSLRFMVESLRAK